MASMLCRALNSFSKLVGKGAVVGCAVYTLVSTCGEVVYLSGPSMKPTIQNADIVLTERFSVRNRKIRVGDIVIAISPVEPETLICKRVTGIAGDVMEHPNVFGFTYKFIPRGHIWLEGDNKDDSTDSRSYGPVPYGLIRGRVCYKLWP